MIVYAIKNKRTPKYIRFVNHKRYIQDVPLFEASHVENPDEATFLLSSLKNKSKFKIVKVVIREITE